MKPTLFIVHGGWHVPESYEKLISALTADGYEVHCPRLPTTNQVSLPLPPPRQLSTSLYSIAVILFG